MRKTLIVAVAVGLIASATTATAATLITGADIVNGSVTGRDIKDGSLRSTDLSKGLRKAIKRAAKAGKAGQAGPAGPKGDAGAPGAAGAAGAKGDAGATGAAGAKGDTGSAGAKGDTGSAGSKGDTGSAGAKGDTGSAGPTGPAGPKGDPGDGVAVVDAAHLGGWALLPRGTNPDPSDNGAAEFVTGPKNTDPAPADFLPPLGSGSLHLTTTNGKNTSATIPLPAGNPGTGAPLLSELTTATYSTYVASQPQPALDVALKITVLGADTGTPSGFTTLIFEPADNAAQGTTSVGHWHRWYPSRGRWWSSRALTNGHCQDAADPTTGWCTLADFTAANPNATVTGMRLEIGQNSGAGWPGFDGNADDVRIGFDGAFARYDLGG